MNKYAWLYMGLSFLVILTIFILNNIFFDDNLISLSFDELQEKINNKDSFVLCLSQTTCNHCADYKPKLQKIAKEYDINFYYTNVDLYSDEDYAAFKKLLQFGDKVGTPMTLFFVDGEEDSIMTRISGDIAEITLLKKLKKYGFID